MTNIRVDDRLPDPALQFLKRCYRFVNEEWQHVVREDVPDQGFERSFRTRCMIDLAEWEISPEREMHLGHALDTASGTVHEVDIVAKHWDVAAIVEIKNRRATPPDKNDVIVLFAKLLDYLAGNPALLLKEICPIFMSNTTFEESGLAACLGLGVHPIAPGLRPMPILVDNAIRIFSEINRGIQINPDVTGKFDDFCAGLNRLGLSLNDTWLTSRCGYLSDDTIVVKARANLNTIALSNDLRQLNADCTWLLDEIRKAK